MADQLSTNRIAARLADALDLIVNCDAFAEPVANESKRDPEAEEVRLQRIEDVLAAGRRALAEYDAAIEAEAAAGVTTAGGLCDCRDRCTGACCPAGVPEVKRG